MNKPFDVEFVIMLWNSDTQTRKKLLEVPKDDFTLGYYKCLQDIKLHLGVIPEFVSEGNRR